MAAENIKFSILVPVYNVEEFLDACVQSVLQQTYKNYELILVNDGSKDTSGEICNRYAQKYSNVFAYHKENAGQLHTREYAIERATGDYYVFLDSDDTLRVNALETINKKICEYDCDCLIYQMERVWAGELLSCAPKFSDVIITDKRELYKKCLLSTTYNSMCRKAVKAEVFQKRTDHSKDYSLRYGEDLVQSLPVFKYSNKVVFVDDVLYNYTVNPKSLSQNYFHSNANIEFSCYLNVLDFLEKENVWNDKDYAQFRNYCAYLLCGLLLTFCKQNIPVRKKREIIKDAMQAEFYRRFLSSARPAELNLGKRTYMFSLFQKGHDRLLVVYLWLYWRIQNLKKQLKK